MFAGTQLFENDGFYHFHPLRYVPAAQPFKHFDDVDAVNGLVLKSCLQVSIIQDNSCLDSLACSTDKPLQIDRCRLLRDGPRTVRVPWPNVRIDGVGLQQVEKNTCRT